MKPELTILSVSFGSGTHLAQNVALTKRLNPETPWRWVIVDNNPEAQDVAALRSVCPQEVLIIDGPAPTPSLYDSGSFHHAAGLMRGLAEVDTHYALVLDPDFFIFREGWIEEVIKHMEARNLSFFGSSWDPLNFNKYQNFPSPHCMFIDLKQVPKASLDFTPDLAFTAGIRDRNAKLKSHFLRFPRLYPWVDLIRIFLSARSSRDTGHRIYRKFTRTHSSEVLSFVVTKSRQERYEQSLKRIPRRLRQAIPRLYGISPKNAAYRELALSGEIHKHYPSATRWEEFEWKGTPFAAHLRQVGLKNS